MPSLEREERARRIIKLSLGIMENIDDLLLIWIHVFNGDGVVY